MDLAQLIPLLSRPEAYPHSVAGPIEVHQTHISVVFLAGPFAYKLKKPLDLGFLDFTTLEKRRHYCLEEVRLNRRLAPREYLGVVPVALRGGEIRVDGDGEVAEWAVWMRRLPEEQTLLKLVGRGMADEATLRRLGRRLARFYAQAEAGPEVAVYGRWAVVARNVRENLDQTEAQAGVTASTAVRGRLRALLEESLARLKPLIEGRAARGSTRDTHGDLHLDHVYVFPDRAPPDDLVAVDCIEFNERFRYADPAADLAFLVMDLAFHGREDLGAALVDSYVECSGDAEVRGLLPFYMSYRAAVRAKVEGFELREPEVPDEERSAAVLSSRAHWLFALGKLEAPERKACMVLLGGLPGTGKSAVADGLVELSGFTRISSDLVRKELAGLAPEDSGGTDFGKGIYTPEWNDRVYGECLKRAETGLFEGKRVVVDASFREDERRATFLLAARRWGVPAFFFLRTAEPEAVRKRLERRPKGESDAGWAVYQRAAALWEEPGPEVRPAVCEIPGYPSKREALEAALAVLRRADLL